MSLRWHGLPALNVTCMHCARILHSIQIVDTCMFGMWITLKFLVKKSVENLEKVPKYISIDMSPPSHSGLCRICIVDYDP